MAIKERQKWGKRLCFCLEHEIVEAFSENGIDLERKLSEGENPALVSPMAHW